jgi:hypothetical protein
LSTWIQEGEEMGSKERWEKVAALIDEALRDEAFREMLRTASDDEKMNLLEERGFTEDERQNLKDDLKTLSADVRAAVIFWL